MKLATWFIVLAAGGLLVAGCSSGSGAAASTTSAGSPTTESSSSAALSSSATPVSATSSTAVSAAQLDAASQTWFSAFCTSLSGVDAYASPDTAGQTLAQEQATVVAAYTGIASSATKATSLLQATPPPTFANGSAVSTETAAAFQTLAGVYGQGAQTIAAMTPSSEAELKTAVDTVESAAKAGAPNSLANVDPSAVAAAKLLPECANAIAP